MHFQCFRRCHQNYSVRMQTCLVAFDIEEFLRAKISTEPGFSNYIVSKFERSLRGNNGITAMGDIRKRPTVHKDGVVFQGLYQVRLKRISE